jgi:hypothetical protein
MHLNLQSSKIEIPNSLQQTVICVTNLIFFLNLRIQYFLLDLLESHGQGTTL